MPVTAETIRLTKGAKLQIGKQVDPVLRALIEAWARAWDQIAQRMELAAYDIAAGSLTEAGTVAALRLTERARQALAVARGQLEALSANADVQISGLVESLTRLGAMTDTRVLASQLPRNAQGMVQRFDVIRPANIQAIVDRSTEQITSRTIPLGASAEESMRSALVTGVPLGMGAGETAAMMVANAEDGFNGGLVRALAIARTETMDAYRQGAAEARAQNADVIEGWEWFAELDDTTCIGCISMDGERFPADEPGPDGHVNCRCVAMPITMTWEDLGIDLPEPEDDLTERGQEWFERQDQEVQQDIMGPTRWAAWSDGLIPWEDLAQFKENDDWRRSLQTTPVKDLDIPSADIEEAG